MPELASLALEAAANDPAPAWIPIAIFGTVGVFMAFVIAWAVRGRRRAAGFRRAQRGAIAAQKVQLGSGATIEDGGAYTVDGILRALSLREPDHGPTGDLPHNEGAEAEALGLKAKIGDSLWVSEPHLFWGRREQGQVFIRIGADEVVEGGDAQTERHLRCFVVLRVACPELTIEVEGGRPVATDGSSQPVDQALGRIGTNGGIWGDLQGFGGPEGLVLVRNDHVTGSMCWPYDLWLAERLAADAGWEPLPDARIGPAWKIPYRLGRKFRPERP